MNQLPKIERNLRSHCALLKVFLSVALLAFPLAQGNADELELRLVGGDAKMFTRATILDAPQVTDSKTASLTSTQLQSMTSFFSGGAVVEGEGTSSYGHCSVEEYGSGQSSIHFGAGHYFYLGGVNGGGEAELMYRLRFLVPATPDLPHGSGVMVKFGGNAGRKWDSEIPIPGGATSLIDGRNSGFTIRFGGQTYDLSQSPRQDFSGVVQTGIPFSFDSDLFVIGSNSSWEGGIGMGLRISDVRNQDIDFPQIVSVGVEKIPLVATASSDLPVSFRVLSGPATLSGNVLTPTGVGIVSVEASQLGNGEYTAAHPIQQRFAITDGIALVKTLRGSAVVLHEGESIPLQVGDSILAKDVIRTGDKSFVRLVFIDGSVMNIGPNSAMKTERFNGREPSIFDIIRGKIRSRISEDYLNQVDKYAPKMYLRTPNAVMGIRGTEFDLSYTIRNGIGTTSMQMIEGLVEAQDLTTGKITMLKDQDSLQVQAPAIVPELGLFDRFGKRLARGATAPHFGAVIPKTSKSLKFEIRNLGVADLTDIKPVISGPNARDFRIIKQPKSLLAPEEKSALAIRFLPRSIGPKRAILRIASSDPEGKPFEVILKGEGVAATPKLVVEWPAGSLVSNGDMRKLGTAVVGLGGNTRTVTLRNTGVKPLTGIQATMAGSHPGDFRLGKVPTSIAPGGKAAFDVTFQPKELGPRSGVVEIRSNDPNTPVFLVQVNGVGGVLK